MKIKICIIMSRYNKDITNKLFSSAKKVLQKELKKKNLYRFNRSSRSL